jgi:hypothetical protein
MSRAVGLFVAAVVAGTGCGDNLETPALTPVQLVDKLRLTPGVSSVEEVDTELTGYRRYTLHFTQPVDHGDPNQGTFEQEVTLLHRDDRAPVPMIVHTSGYADDWGDRPVELTQLLSANQVSIEHRYFGSSRPVPTDWTRLTIAQMAADEHMIIQALRPIYGGAFLTTGASKGGMTAVFHRKFYPDDVDGTVAYVAPISFGAPDPRYASFLDTLGPEGCREKVRDLAVDMLQSRRNQIQARAALQTEHSYTRIPIGPAVEAAIGSFEWTFWQFAGVDECSKVPSASVASDAEVFDFLEEISPVSDCDDEQIRAFEPYYYQSYSQLGYPAGVGEYLQQYLRYKDSDYLSELPTQAPPLDRTAMTEILDFVGTHGDRLLFIYGAWDPWTAGKVVLGDATDSALFVHHEGTHMTRITTLDAADRAVALGMVQAWTGVKPEVPRVRWPGAQSAEPRQRLPRMRLTALAAPK